MAAVGGRNVLGPGLTVVGRAQIPVPPEPFASLAPADGQYHRAVLERLDLAVGRGRAPPFGPARAGDDLNRVRPRVALIGRLPQDDHRVRLAEETHVGQQDRAVLELRHAVMTVEHRLVARPSAFRERPLLAPCIAAVRRTRQADAHPRLSDVTIRDKQVTIAQSLQRRTLAAGGDDHTVLANKMSHLVPSFLSLSITQVMMLYPYS